MEYFLSFEHRIKAMKLKSENAVSPSRLHTGA